MLRLLALLFAFAVPALAQPAITGEDLAEIRAVIHRQATADPAHSTLYCTTVDISATGLQLNSTWHLMKWPIDSGEPAYFRIHRVN